MKKRPKFGMGPFQTIKTDLKMKLSLLFLLTMTIAMQANSSYSQTKRVTLDMENVTVAQVINKIESTTEFKFFYNTRVVDLERKVTVKFKKTKIDKILKELFSNVATNYVLDDRKIVLRKKEDFKKIIGKRDLIKQQAEVNGTITDIAGTPLPGASIIEKGTTNGVTSDFDGNFFITLEGDTPILVVSYIGYAEKEVPVHGETSFIIALQERAAGLDEVVLIGYQTQTRAQLTGSVASVNLSEANKAPMANVAEALEGGRVSGVSTIASGSPGSAPIVRIRGFSSPNSNNPLYIIDGTQTTDTSILNSINPNDIDQFNVLKDGAASIYGARASNGVIIITTKNGGYNQNKINVNLDLYAGIATATNLPELTNAQQLGEVFFESLRNDGVPVSHPQYGDGPSPVVPSKLLGVPVNATVDPNGTDFLDELFRDAPTQNFSLGLSNGNAFGKYAFSASYLNRQGIIVTTHFKRGQIRLNSEFKIGEKIKVGQHLNASFGNSRFAAIDALGNVVQSAFRVNPLIPVRDDNGAFAGSYVGSSGLGSATTNPVADQLRAGDNFFKQSRLLGDVYASWEFAKGATIKTVIGGDINSFNDRNFVPLNPEHAQAISTNSLTQQNQDFYNWVWTTTLNYKKTFGKHHVNVLLGTEANSNSGKGSQITRTDFLFETPDFYLLNNGSGTPNVDFAFDSENTLSSYFGSVNYSYERKYLLTATLRRDRSSRFIGDNQSDLFPAFSLGWVLSEEDIYPKDAIINRVKLKGSWGALGNQTLPVNNPTLNISQIDQEFANYGFTGSGGVSTGAALGSVGNPDLTWEVSKTINIGAELGLFDNSLNLSVEYFDITTEDLISQDFSVISETAIDADAPYVNIGSIENKGFDASLVYNKATPSGFSYGIDMNFSTYKNEVTKLVSSFQTGASFSFIGSSPSRTQVGEPIASFFGRKVDGVFKSEEEVANAPDQGFVSNADGVGRLKYRDLNGDNVINDDDRGFIGSPHPDFTYGININLGYKGFDFSALVSGSQGNEIYNYIKVFSDFPTFFNENRSTRVLNSFSASNPNSNIPALSSIVVNEEINPNSYFIEDGSFLRLKNVQLGYSFPDLVLDKLGFDDLRLFISCTNLFTITGYDGLDPEIPPGVTNTGSIDNLTMGVDAGIFPVSRIFTLGANLKL